MRSHRWGAVMAVLLAVLVVSAAASAQPQGRTDETGRAIGYWEAYEASMAPYAPYTTTGRTDETGRAIGYWEAYEAYLRR